jgi:hypothetical protein
MQKGGKNIVSTAHRATLWTSILILLLSTGCNLSSNRSAPPASVVDTSSTSTGQDVVQETGAAPTPGTSEFEPPPPTGLVNQLYAGVESGEWTYEQGLVQALKIFTGEAQVQTDSSGKKPASLEGSGLVREAQVYLNSGQDVGMRAEIERLLSVIAPAPERLLEVADPESVSRARGPGYAARFNITEDCAALYEKGFPAGSGLKCLLYKEGGISGQLLRVFYPIPSVPLDYADQAYDGMMQAFQTYSTLKPNGAAPQMKGADLLFVLLPEIEDPTTLAMVPTTGSDDRCLIVVYLGAIQENETGKSAPDDYGHFLQTIAHEMFHCFQTWNYPAQADGTWKVQDWWGEGTAEFFSNVVYPKVNSEWSWTGTFSYHSSHRPLTELDYDNFVFFQYLADEQGLNAVLNLIGAMPSTGNEADQAAALSKLSGMDALFHKFGQAFLDGQIIDSSGSAVPTLPAYVLPEDVITVKEAQIRLLGGEPFVLKRYALVFPQGYRYTVAQIDKSKAPATASSRIDLSNSAWGDLPEQVLTACSPVTYLQLVTTTQAGSGEAAVEVSLTPQEELACDNCLIGTWDLDTPSFADYLAAPFKDTPGLFSIDSMGGIWKLHFSPQSIVRGEYDYYVGYELDQTGGGSGFGVLAQVLLDITGDGAAQFITDGVGHVTFNLLKDNLSMEQTILINGQEVPGGGNLMSGMGPSLSNGISGEAQYSCDDDTGTLYLAYDLGGSLAEPIKYKRISKSP